MKLALIDLDGVAADDSFRVPFALDKNWPEYFNKERMFADPVWPQSKALIERLQNEGWTIAYLTGRRSAVRDVSEAWLDANDFPLGRVMMREPLWYKAGVLSETPLWPTARLADFKEAVIRRLLAQGNYNDVVLFDDDPEVIRTVQEQIGVDHAVLCEWSVKAPAMVTLAEV